jgi:hypothetical protein
MNEVFCKGLKYIFITWLHKGICKSVSLGLRYHEKEKKSGIKHELIIIFPREIECPNENKVLRKIAILFCIFF